jgi:hypothetical protein
MVIWDDFDKRGTKFLCDKCEKDISPQVYREYHKRKPWWRFWQKFTFDSYRHRNHGYRRFVKQWEFSFRKRHYVLMQLDQHK